MSRFESEVVGDPQLVAMVLSPPDEADLVVLPLWGEIERLTKVMNDAYKKGLE
ncbi:MAG: hypothetical protein KJO36_09325 [Acidimicrobiia bacterium]|nr:hypothetical protein [Acidimicrobiia bacterium]NND01887.1 hypothetical protein [Acidimicrobiia bacterium]